MSWKSIALGCAIGAASLMMAGASQAQNDYKCYKVKKDVVNFPATATTVDQFGSESVEVKKAFLACNPANVNGSLIPNPGSHLLCFKVKGAKLDPAPHLSMTNDFGNSTVFAKKPFLVCMDSSKSVIP